MTYSDCGNPFQNNDFHNHWQQTWFYSKLRRCGSYQTEYTVLVKTTDVNKTNLAQKLKFFLNNGQRNRLWWLKQFMLLKQSLFGTKVNGFFHFKYLYFMC